MILVPQSSYPSFSPLQVFLLLSSWQMTGLDPSTDSVLSLACFVTDAKLKKLEPNGFEVIIHHDQVRLDQMDAWCTKTHGESGLTAACIDSTTTAEQAVDGLLTYVKQLVPEKGTALLAGNSIHADKSFLVKPPYDQVINHLHYRLFDVSAIKEAMRRWAPVSVLEKSPEKRYKHTARDDIEESIEEARYYRSLFEQM
jgi:oligoribonuclease